MRTFLVITTSLWGYGYTYNDSKGARSLTNKFRKVKSYKELKHSDEIGGIKFKENCFKI